MLETVEYAHVLPIKSKPAAGETPPPKPIILRFHSRLIRAAVFKFKKLVLVKTEKVYITEDLTALNYRKLAKVKADPATARAWSFAGKIFYTKKGDADEKRLTA